MPLYRTHVLGNPFQVGEKFVSLFKKHAETVLKNGSFATSHYFNLICQFAVNN